MLTPMQTTYTCSLNPKARKGFIKPKTSENTLKYIKVLHKPFLVYERKLVFILILLKNQLKKVPNCFATLLPNNPNPNSTLFLSLLVAEHKYFINGD